MKKRNFFKLTSGLLLLIALSLTQCDLQCTDQIHDESNFLVSVDDFGSNPGDLNMYAYVPAEISGEAPLVVALHGCTQDAKTYAVDSGWTDLADEYKFYLLFPQQNSANNQNRCFNWFEPGDIGRDKGEALSVKQMVDKMKTDHDIDSKKVFVTGLSAGGYFSAVMAATYPDVFAGAAVMAGGPYKCASNVSSALTCMYSCPSKTGKAWGEYIASAYPGYTGPYPKISYWTGTSDATVVPANKTEALKQWAYILGLGDTSGLTETIQGHTHRVYKNSNGEALMESWDIKEMAHAITVDPDGTNGKSGGVNNAYSKDYNVWSSYETAKFWGLPDQIAPTVGIFSPSNGATVSGKVPVSITASDNIAVAKVEIYIDETLNIALSTSPYKYLWDAAQSTNGDHVILAKAYDATGNSNSAFIDVRVTGGIEDTKAPVISADKAAGTYVSSVTVRLSSDEPSTIIHYTTDGETPTQSSAVYASDLTFSATTTLKFFGIDRAGNISEVISITYTVNPAVYSETISATLTVHYAAGRITAAEFNDLGLGTNNSGINPGKIRYGYMKNVTLYKLIENGDWVTDQSI